MDTTEPVFVAMYALVCLICIVDTKDVNFWYSVEMTRHVSMISITLSTKELDETSPGYVLLLSDKVISSDFFFFFKKILGT